MPHLRHIIAMFLLLAISSEIFAAENTFSPEQIEFFEKQIRPVFVEHCYECHGAETQEASLRLDSRQSLIKGGDTGPAIVPGNVDQGELLQALAYDPDGYQMPPEGKLPQPTIDAIRKWVAMGAPWPNENIAASTAESAFDLEERAKHWSFQPLSAQPIPDVDSTGWCRNEIDQFILAKLKQNHLTPAEETDRRTWIRRASLDVTGLPPSMSEVKAFLNDQSENAYENVVNRLLASPRFGERWGRHWLDVVRYAESRGHEFDYDVANAWQYRDYVIRAMNADVPFDQFVVEHVAGDLLTPETRYPRRLTNGSSDNESILGTGFWLLGEWVHSPVDIRQEEADRFDNMIDVYSKAFLGLTVACARCHDHKFDPIRQKDFYALQGFLQSSSYQQARFQTMIPNQGVAKQLQELEIDSARKFREIVNEESRQVIQQLPEYLLTAQEFVKAHELVEESEVFEGFESGDYDRWKVTGDAFGALPQTAQTIAEYQGDVKANGQFFVNSHQKRNNGPGDAATGTMTSAEFQIDCDEISMLIGGGQHARKTCVNLIVGGKPVRTMTGDNSNVMRRKSWDVRDLQFQRAHIQIVDDEKGGWGNIGVDEIVFSKRGINPENIHSLAESKGLDPLILNSWIQHLATLDQPDDPFYRFSKTYDLKTTRRHTNQPESESSPGSTSLTVYRPADLIAAGPGFRSATADEDAFYLYLNSNRQDHLFPESSITWDSFWNRARRSPRSQGEPGAMQGWNRAGRILRTPSFEIKTANVFALVRGSVNTYAAVDSHILIKGPLHGKLTRKNNGKAEWHWIEHNITGYEKHRAHLEFVPDSDGEFAVAAVVLADTLDQAKTAVALPAVLLNEEQQSLTAAAKAIQAKLLEVQHVPNLNLIAARPAIFGLFHPPVHNRLTQLQAAYERSREKLAMQAQFESETAPTLLDGTAEDEYVFIRGNWKKQGETVSRRFLEVFQGAEVQHSGSGRLQLAEEMVNPEQTPILPRVIVNRIWKHYFGRGICPTPNDFGHLGQKPSHPELLDWLALELIRSKWSLKQIHRTILLSSTYRMSSQKQENPKIAEVDPGNILLHRMNIKRLEGEAIRDSLLFVSGRLDTTMYGPSVPIHLTPFLEGRGRPSQSGPVDGAGRRSLYLSVRRNFPEPFFQAFDFPNPHTSIGRRNVSNVPAQALALMNNPMVIEQAKLWAQQLVIETPGSSTEARIQRLFEQAFSRPPTDEEVMFGVSFLNAQMKELSLTSDDTTLWEDYCHVLINSKEFIFVR